MDLKYDKTTAVSDLALKQDILEVGDNITIVNNRISASSQLQGTTTIANVENLQTALNDKQDNITSTTDIDCSTITTSDSGTNKIGKLSIINDGSVMRVQYNNTSVVTILLISNLLLMSVFDV